MNNNTGVTESGFNDPAEVYPNPFSDHTVLEVKCTIHNARVILADVYGKTVSEMKNVNRRSIVLKRNNLPCGVCFARLLQDNNTIAANAVLWLIKK